MIDLLKSNYYIKFGVINILYVVVHCLVIYNDKEWVILNPMEFKREEVQYLLSLVLTRYHQLKKSEPNTNDDVINDSIKNELSVLRSLYNKIESINSILRDDNS